MDGKPGGEERPAEGVENVEDCDDLPGDEVSDEGLLMGEPPKPL